MTNMTIEHAIQHIDNEILELQNNKAFLESLDTSKVLTEDEWHTICDTDLRTSDILSIFIKNIFPDATDIQIGCNYVTFILCSIKCFLPTSAIRGIEIDKSWYKNLKKPEISDLESIEYIKLKYYNEITDWNDKVRSMTCSYNKIINAILWITKYKWKQEEYKKEFEERDKALKIKYDEAIEIYNKELNEQNKIINLIKEELLPKLQTFTSDIKFHKSYGLFNNNINLNDILNNN